jgi:hypothetical protein
MMMRMAARIELEAGAQTRQAPGAGRRRQAQADTAGARRRQAQAGAGRRRQAQAGAGRRRQAGAGRQAQAQVCVWLPLLLLLPPPYDSRVQQACSPTLSAPAAVPCRQTSRTRCCHSPDAASSTQSPLLNRRHRRRRQLSCGGGVSRWCGHRDCTAPNKNMPVTCFVSL